MTTSVFRATPLLAIFLLAGAAAAQDHHDGVAVGAHGILLYTHADPAVGGQARDEVYLTQPMLLGMARWRALSGMATIDLEGWTLDRGELNASVAGEGYVDRRHPHTFLHEAVASGTLSGGPVAASLSVGRGFAPFGTDDPMVRPFVKYPANHHLSQILERWIAIGAVRWGPATLEAGLLNGDEPTGPESLGELSHFGDSWSARVTVRPVPSLEMQASHARLESPENALGEGLDQRKWSASARYEGVAGAWPVYALGEWAQTDEYSRDRKAFAFSTLLAEGGVTTPLAELALRLERTSRPEEERLEDPFRSLRPHTDGNIVGVTRWRSVTAHVERAFHTGAVRWSPMVEAQWLDVREITGSIFDPAAFYGDASQWSLSLGLRVGAGARHSRMGRYAVARPM